jgi:hypothetical protein
MMSRKLCPTCGAEIEADRPSGLCPTCLLTEGLSAETLRRDAPLQCTKCGSALGDHARFCAECGAPAASPPAEGDPIRAALEAQLRGQYRIIRLLGRGGMGAVYLARDLTLEREVAVKVIRTASHARETYERFRREAKTAARLSHPNIVPLHTFGEVDGMPYFVMGYVRGESLAARLARDGKMTEEEGLRVLAEIAGALDHAHRQGVVHRDVKPDNVLIEDESGRAMLTDFGVAKALGRDETMTFSGSVVGTPQFMSPEQAGGHGDIDGRSDIYSLGVMAYAILSGRLPFDGATAAEVLNRHLTQAPPSLRSLNPNLSHATTQAVERCLAKDPSKRWPDAKSLKLALGASEESELPDALRAVEGRGIPGLAIVLAYIVGFGLFGSLHGFWDDGGWIFYWSQSIVVVLIYLFILGRLRSEGHAIAQAQAAIWREPSWWIWWYPRSWRRRGNVWDRLPREVRIIRAVLPMIWVFMPMIIFPLHFVFEEVLGKPLATNIFATGAVILPLVATIVVWLVADTRVRRKLKHQGIRGEDLGRILHSVPPSRGSFWARPHIAAILEPGAESGRAPRADSTHEHLQSILRYADDLSGPLRHLGAEAASAARLLIASVEDADREIAELSLSLEAGEEERLSAKIAALASADSVPLRTLLQKELELIRGLAERMEEAKEIRSRRMEMLRTLSLHLSALRARSAETGEPGTVTDRVRALCDDIATLALPERT